jgi:endonuclease YncB( thermonuclease family)
MSWRTAGSPSRLGYRPRPRSLVRRLLDYGLTAAILLMLAIVSVRLDRVATKQLAGEAVVNDGDTLTLKGERIRLKGIDAPEYSQTCEMNGARYPCGRRSREALIELARGAVECAGWERDRYHRLLAVCKAGGADINRRLVEEGWAVAYGDYADAEATARE